MKELLEERERLIQRLNWLGLRSTGSERIERRIKEIEEKLKREGVRGA